VSRPPATGFDDLDELLRDFVAGARGALGGNFVGAYLQGSFALGAADEHSDVDFVVVTERELSAAEQSAVQTLHGRLYERDVPWAQHLEGSYAPRGILRRVDPERRRFFFLDNGARELVWDEHCNSAVVRWVLRRHGIVLAGPPPVELIEPVSAEALGAEARVKIAEYADWARGLDGMSRWQQPYLVLTFCRMLRAVAEGDVVSKQAAGEWAIETLDARWSPLIRRALADRPDPWGRVHRRAEPEVVEETLRFVEYASRCGREESNLQGPKPAGT
jgi:predicted nucleotidyltransferase